MADENTHLKLLRMYLKDASFESPSAPECFTIKSEPQAEVTMRVSVRPLPGETYEVVLAATMTTRAEGVTLYLCEVQQAGLFRAQGHDPAELERRLHVQCPRQLFPFLREAVANLAMKAGFPPLLITPGRFEEQFQQSKRPGAAGG